MPGRPLKVLIVDDEEAMREVLEMRLQSWGFEVGLAATGTEGRQMAESFEPDIVVTDVVMPGGMSGRQLAVRLLASHPRQKIIFTSGYNVEETNTDFFRRGGAVFLQKPYTRTDLVRAVRECLDKQAGSG